MEVREKLGVIGVVAVSSRKTSEPKAPVKGAGSGALMGAGQGALGSVFAGGQACQSGEPFFCAFGLALGIVLAPPAALIGGVVGASRAHPAEEVQAADASLRTALAETKPHEHLRDWLVNVGRERTGFTLLNLSDVKPGIGYRTLATEGVDTVLELDLTDFRVESHGRIDPDLTIRIDTRARLVRTADNREVYRRGWRYESHERSYFDMAANSAKLLRTEIREGYEKLADQMIYDLFIGTAPEKPGRARAGTVWTVEAPKTVEQGTARVSELKPHMKKASAEISSKTAGEFVSGKPPLVEKTAAATSGIDQQAGLVAPPAVSIDFERDRPQIIKAIKEYYDGPGESYDHPTSGQGGTMGTLKTLTKLGSAGDQIEVEAEYTWVNNNPSMMEWPHDGKFVLKKEGDTYKVVRMWSKNFGWK